eukprot:PhM_4_TR19011/c0_g1_i1/m.44957
MWKHNFNVTRRPFFTSEFAPQYFFIFAHTCDRVLVHRSPSLVKPPTEQQQQQQQRRVPWEAVLRHEAFIGTDRLTGDEMTLSNENVLDSIFIVDRAPSCGLEVHMRDLHSPVTKNEAINTTDSDFTNIGNFILYLLPGDACFVPQLNKSWAIDKMCVRRERGVAKSQQQLVLPQVLHRKYDAAKHAVRRDRVFVREDYFGSVEDERHSNNNKDSQVVDGEIKDWHAYAAEVARQAKNYRNKKGGASDNTNRPSADDVDEQKL